MTTQVLVVEDDAAIAELIAFTLQRAGYLPVLADSAEQAMECLAEMVPQVAIIDWMLPGHSGLWLVQQLRRDRATTLLPIIMVSAMVEDSQRVEGLENWIDDYVAKPFSPQNLVARIDALLRYDVPISREEILRVGPLTLDPISYVVTLTGISLVVRLIEFKLLRLMMANPERVFRRKELLERVWGTSTTIDERTVDVHMRRLRMALGAEGRSLVKTVRGDGYQLVSVPTATALGERIAQ